MCNTLRKNNATCFYQPSDKMQKVFAGIFSGLLSQRQRLAPGDAVRRCPTRGIDRHHRHPQFNNFSEPPVEFPTEMVILYPDRFGANLAKAPGENLPRGTEPREPTGQFWLLANRSGMGLFPLP
jgi:hypothetical protein